MDELKQFSTKLIENEQEVLHIVDGYILRYSRHFEKSFTEILNMVRTLPGKKVSKKYSFNNMHRSDMDNVLNSIYTEINPCYLEKNKFISIFETYLDYNYFLGPYLSLRRFEEYDIGQIIDNIKKLRQIVPNLNEIFRDMHNGKCEYI